MAVEDKGLLMDGERSELGYEDIYNIYKRESRQGALSPVARDFYALLNDLIYTLREEYLEAQSKDPVSFRTRSIHSQLREVEKLANWIFELRARKIMKLAQMNLRGEGGEKANLLPEEKSLLESITTALKETYERALRGLTKSRERGKPPDDSEKRTGTPGRRLGIEEGSDRESIGAEPGRDAHSAEIRRIERSSGVVVRIKDDITPFVGPDEVVYTLHAHDVACVPMDVAKILLDGGMAERVEPLSSNSVGEIAVEPEKPDP